MVILITKTKQCVNFQFLALLSNGKLYTITLCGVPDLLKTPEPQELGALALIGLGQKKDISIPDGNGECIYKFLAR